MSCHIFIFAFKEEAAEFIKKLKRPTKEKKMGVQFYKGIYGGLNVFIGLTGCGSKGVQPLLNIMLTECRHPERVWNIGFSGSLNESFLVGDVIQVNRVFDFKFVDLNQNFTLHNNLPSGSCYTSKHEVDNVITKNKIYNNCSADVVDMELAYISMQLPLGLNFSSIKIVSDRADTSVLKSIRAKSVELARVLEAKVFKIIENEY